MSYFKKNHILKINLSVFLIYMIASAAFAKHFAGLFFVIQLLGWLIHGGGAVLLGLLLLLPGDRPGQQLTKKEAKELILAGLIILLIGFSVCSIIIPSALDYTPN